MTETKTNPHADQRQRLRNAVKTWMGDPDRTDDHDTEADAIGDHLADQDLQIVPRVPSNTSFRVLADGNPVRTYRGELMGHLDADDAVLYFLLAVRAAEETGESVNVTVRPATDREMVAGLMGDRSAHNPPVDIEPTLFAVLLDEDPDYRTVNFTDDNGQPVGLRLSRDMAEGLAHALTDEVATWDGDEDDDLEDDE